MEPLEEIKKCISEAKNITLIPSENEPESLTSCLALFYTLKELGKNVNVIIENLPEKLNFLVPSLDFIASPKNLVISIPRSLADVSQIYYEKNDDNLKIHLTVDKGQIKKDGVAFYFQDAKPDLVITLGVQDFRKQLEGNLNSFGYLLDAPIINIDNNQENNRFGQINIVEQKSISEITLCLITSIDENLISKNTANCLLAGLVIYYENFKSARVNSEIFEITSYLIKKGALHQQVVENLHKMTRKEVHFLTNIFQNLNTAEQSETSFAILDSNEFHNFSELEAAMAVEKIQSIGIHENVLVLWKSHSSASAIKGFFYSRNPQLLNKILQTMHGVNKNNWIFLVMPGLDIAAAKEEIIKLLP